MSGPRAGEEDRDPTKRETMTAETRRPRVWHPLLIGIFPVLFLYSHNVQEVRIADAAPLFLASLLLALLVWLAGRLLVKDPAKSGLIATTLLALFFTYGHAHNLATSALNMLAYFGLFSRSLVLRQNALLQGLLAAFWLWLAFRIVRRVIGAKGDLGRATTLVNIAAAVLVLASAGGILWSEAGRSPYRSASRPTGSGAAGLPLGYAPDIYFLVLDGYGRADILAEHYAYDNSAFLDSLKASGFYIADGSRANYGWTFLSLASSLNLDYIDRLAAAAGMAKPDRRFLFDLIKNNKAVATLKARGYRYVHFGSTWGATQTSPQADVEVTFRRGGFRSEFARLLLSTTMLKAAAVARDADLASRHLYGLEKLRSIARMKGPKFVFMHLLPPHHPYLFDRDGAIKRYAHLSDQFEFDKQLWGEKEAYTDQLAFITGRIRLALDDILRDSARPPVIILQSDHGPTMPGAPAATLQKARLSILNAIRLPGTAAGLYGSMSPVNTFRIVFNAVFGDDWPVLEDRHYFSEYSEPFGFRRVTEGDAEGGRETGAAPHEGAAPERGTPAG